MYMRHAARWERKGASAIKGKAPMSARRDRIEQPRSVDHTLSRNDPLPKKAGPDETITHHISGS
jgi:hypothetical protein